MAWISNDYMVQLEDDGRGAGGGGDDGWVIGPRLRDRASLHSDIWQGSVADLASRHGIAVYPVGGWWREKKDFERTDRSVRYALIVTVRTAADIDLYVSSRMITFPLGDLSC